MKNVSTQQRVTRPRAGHWTLTLCCLQNCSPTHRRPELITDTGLQNNIRQHICSTRRINLDISLCNVENKTKITFHLRLVAQHSTAHASDSPTARTQDTADQLTVPVLFLVPVLLRCLGCTVLWLYTPFTVVAKCCNNLHVYVVYLYLHMVLQTTIFLTDWPHM